MNFNNFHPMYIGHNVLVKGSGFKGELEKNQYLFLYIAKGYQKILYNNIYKTVSEGTFIIFPPLSTHDRYYDGSATAQNYYIIFDYDGDFSNFGIPFELYTFYKILPSAEIEMLIDKMQFEQYNEMPYNDDYCKLKCHELFIELYRKHNKHYQRQFLSSDNFTKTMKSIMENYEQSLSLEEYAKMCNMSKYHFCRTFKKQFGISPITYRNSLRIQRARELLETTNFSISHISESVGFSNVATFCSAFRNFETVSPIQYREKFSKS